jgi:S1-C subfamily serine protease
MQMKPTVRSLISANYPIREVDVTREPQLARDFRVDRIPCFVMLVDGQEVDRVVGATSSDRLVQMFDRARVRLQSPDTPAATPAAQPVPWPAGQPSASDSAQASVPIDAHAQARSIPVEQAHSVPVDPVNSVPVDTGPSNNPPANTGPSVLDSPSSLLTATVRLLVEDDSGRSFGTGTIIDARSGEALIITCGHIFRASQGKGKVTVDLYEAAPQGLRSVGQVQAQVISYDLDRDVALLSVRPNRPVSVAPIAPPGTPIERGDRAASIGCSNGQDPTLLATRVTSRDRYQGPPNIETSGAPVEGRSGGGLFNAQGQLVGVCFAADHEGNEGLYAALESIHGELDRLGLKEIYAKSTTETAVPEPPVVRGQEPLAPVMPLPESIAVGPTAIAADVEPVPAGLDAAEQAAFEEIMSRAATHEVICIVRPKEPGGESEVIALDSVSPEFIRALQAHRSSAADSVTR